MCEGRHGPSHEAKQCSNSLADGRPVAKFAIFFLLVPMVAHPDDINHSVHKGLEA